MSSQVRVRTAASTAVVGVLALGLATACSGGTPATTSSHTVTITAPSETGAKGAPARPRPSAPTSEVRNRRHDAGAVVRVRDVAGVKVIVLDRWTVNGLPDAALARDGVPVQPHPGGRFSNQNRTKTYAVPVATGAIAVVNTCVPDDHGTPGMTSAPQPLVDWLHRDRSRDVVLLTYDDRGRAVRVDTDPRCEGQAGGGQGGGDTGGGSGGDGGGGFGGGNGGGD